MFGGLARTRRILHGFSSFFHRAFVAGEECVVDLSEAQSEGSEQHRARQLS